MEIPNIVEAVNKMYADSASISPARSIWASKLGHPCARSIAFEQVAYGEKTKPSAALMQRFEVGNLMETLTIRDLQEALKPQDIRVEQTNVPIPFNAENIGGKVDCVMVMPDRKTFFPVEIKSQTPMVFGKIKSLKDMYESDHVWMRCYPAQLMIYLYFTNCENGLFVFRNLNGGIDQLNVTLDYEYTETLLQKAKLVNNCVQKWKDRFIKNSTDPHIDDELPERIPFAGNVCGDCPFMSRCCPDMVGRAGIEDLLWDVELNALCNIREQSKEVKDTYEDADEKIKKHAKASVAELKKGETKTLITQDFIIECKGSERTNYDVPEDIKKKYASKAVSIRTTINRVKK